MGYYPIAIDISGKKCLVVGGGEVALRKALALSEAGARVTVIAPDVDPRLELVPGVEILRRLYRKGDVSDCVLVFAATDDRAVNVEVSKDARAKGIPANVVDDPELCSFIVPSVVRRGDLIIATTTSGKAPMLSSNIRKELEERYGPEYAAYVDLLGEARAAIKARYARPQDREAAFSRLLDSGILELLRQGQADEARKKAQECI